MATALSPSEMTKPGREYRIPLFLKKYKEGDDFVLMNNQKVKLIYDERVYKQLEKKQGLSTIQFTATNGKILKLKDFQKTKEFGGKTESTTQIEEKEIVSIRQQLSDIRSKTGEPTVPIKINSVIYNVADIQKTPGTPKSDFHFLDINGKEIVWMSHKDGNKASDFQQWGGVSKVVPNVNKHPETKEFIEQVKENFEEGFPPKTNIVKDISDKKLKAQAVYGDNYKPGSRQYGRDNVTLVLQGPVKLVKVGQYYTIKSNHTHKNGEQLTGEYEPTFNGTYRQGRGQPVANARLGIWPKVVKNRKNTIILPKK
jgi:hypothetical protein